MSKDLRRLEYLVLAMMCIGFAVMFATYMVVKQAWVFIAGFPYIVAVAKVYDVRRAKLIRKYVSDPKIRFAFNNTELAVSVFVAFWFGMLFGLIVGVLLP